MIEKALVFGNGQRPNAADGRRKKILDFLWKKLVVVYARLI